MNHKVYSSDLEMLFNKFGEHDELTVVDNEYEYRIKRKSKYR